MYRDLQYWGICSLLEMVLKVLEGVEYDTRSNL